MKSEIKKPRNEVFLLPNINNDNYRKTLETIYFQKNTKQIYKINKNIKERYLLYNIQNISYLPENINYNEKHIDIKYHWIREKVEEKDLVKLKYVQSSENTADMMTKSLVGELHVKHCNTVIS